MQPVFSEPRDGIARALFGDGGKSKISSIFLAATFTHEFPLGTAVPCRVDLTVGSGRGGVAVFTIWEVAGGLPQLCGRLGAPPEAKCFEVL